MILVDKGGVPMTGGARAENLGIVQNFLRVEWIGGGHVSLSTTAH